MTEYDYSPGAWERFMAHQSRVSKWVNQTGAQSHYADPFTASPALRDRSFYDEPDRTAHGPPPTRVKTHYPRQEDPYRHTSSRPYYEQERGRSRSRSFENHSSSSSVKPRSTRSLSHTTRTSSNYRRPSRSYTVQVLYPPPAPPPPQPHYYSQPHTHYKRLQSVRPHTSSPHYLPEQSHGSRQRTAYLPPPRPGQSYMIPNGRVEYHRPPVPKKPQPLLQRLFGFMGSGSHGPHKSHRSLRKRSSY